MHNLMQKKKKKQLQQVARFVAHANEHLVGVNEYICMHVHAYVRTRVPAEITQRSPDAFVSQAETADEACVSH